MSNWHPCSAVQKRENKRGGEGRGPFKKQQGSHCATGLPLKKKEIAISPESISALGKRELVARTYYSTLSSQNGLRDLREEEKYTRTDDHKDGAAWIELGMACAPCCSGASRSKHSVFFLCACSWWVEPLIIADFICCDKRFRTEQCLPACLCVPKQNKTKKARLQSLVLSCLSFICCKSPSFLPVLGWLHRAMDRYDDD